MKKSKPHPNYSRARHFDIQKHWRKLGPIFKSKEAEKIWVPCMKEWKVVAHKNERPYPTIASYDLSEWRWYPPTRGRHPAFWNFVCYRACHWLVDLGLYVAMTAYPDVPWRILTRRNGHSTVWNGDFKNPVLFDANYLALKVCPKETLKLVYRGRKFRPGRYLKPELHAK